MSGCAPSVTADPPTESPEAPALGSDVDDRCDGLISPVDYEGLWEGDLEPLGYFSYGAASTANMWATALVQSEALICSWGDETGAPAALLIVMGEGEDGARRTAATFADASSPYAAVPILDGAYVACRGDEVKSCHWNLLYGSDWISLMIVGLTADDIVSAEVVTTAQGPLVSALAEAVGALDIPATPQATPTVDCNALLSPDALAGPLGVEAAQIAVLPSPSLEERPLEESSPEIGQMMWKYAADLLGYSSCGIQIDGQVVGAVLSARDSAWVLQDSSAQQPQLTPIDGHGDGVKDCTGDDSATSCIVAFASGDDLFHSQFVVPTGMDGAAIALAVLELMLV